jgi:hypothetical protein
MGGVVKGLSKKELIRDLISFVCPSFLVSKFHSVGQARWGFLRIISCLGWSEADGVMRIRIQLRQE